MPEALPPLALLSLPPLAHNRTPPDMSAEPQQAIRFLLLLGEGLHRFGAPSHRIEEALSAAAARLGLTARFFATPTSLYAAFGPPEEQRTSLIRVEPGAVDLEKLSALDALVEDVIAARLGVDAGWARAQELLASAPRYGPLEEVAAYGLASGSAALLLGGGLAEGAAAGAVGTALGTLSRATAPLPAVARVYELLAAFVAAAAAALIAHHFPVSAGMATLAGLIVLVPGLTLTVALNEIAMRHLSSGTARLTGAAVVFLEIIFGVAVAQQLTSGLEPLLHEPAHPLPAWARPFALLLTVPALMVLFRAPARALGWILAACFLALLGARLGARWLSPELGACMGAFFLGLGSNAYERWLRRPSSVPLVPGMVILVPGSLGFRSLSALLQRETLAGIETAFAMTMVAISIVAGLLLAGAVLPPRRGAPP